MRARLRCSLWVVGVALAIPATVTPAIAQDVAYSGSVQFSTGEYIFAQRTHSLYLVNGLTGSQGRLTLNASVPLILQSTPWVSYAGGGLVPSGGTQHGEVSGHMGRGRFDRDGVRLADTTSYEEIGLGDPLARLDLEVLRGSGSLPAIRVNVSAKAPIADLDRGFGTGEWDYSAGLSITRGFGTTFVFVDVAYWVLGDLPDLELQDPVAYSLAVGRALGAGRWGLLGSISGFTRILPDTDPPLHVGLGLSRILEARRSLSAGVSFGLTESSPDVSASFGWRIGL